MFKTVLMITTFLFSGVVYASDINNNNNVVELTPYQWIVRSHAKSPIDFIGLAAEAAEMRARYNRTCLKILLSDELTAEDKYDFNLKLCPSDAYMLESYERDYEKARKYKGSINCKELRDDLARCSVADHISLSDKPEPEELVLVGRLTEISKAVDIWDFLARSLKSYKQEGSPQDPAFTKQLLVEMHYALSKVTWNIEEIQEKGKMGPSVSDKRFFDESSYATYVMESIVLYLKIVENVNDDQIPIMPIIYEHLSAREFTDLGDNFLLCLLVDELSSSAKLSDETFKNNMKELTKDKKVVTYLPTHKINELYSKLEMQGKFSNTFVDLLISCDEPLSRHILRKPAMRELARKFTLTRNCLLFEEFYVPIVEYEKEKAREARAAELAEKQKVLEATKESRANSFVSNLPSQPARKPQKAKKKGAKKIQAVSQPKPQVIEDDESEDIANDVVEVAKLAPAAVAAVKSKSKVKLPTEKQKRDAKKAAKLEALNQVLVERLTVADRNKQSQERMIAGIQVEFAKDFTPSLDELEIYSRIWGPASERKTLCWGDLRGQLDKCGWTFSTGDGSYVILTPPEWFGRVKVIADAALNINFRHSKFMIHKPHDDALAPMPPYVLAFMREALSGAIGLSEVVVQAMVKKLGAKK